MRSRATERKDRRAQKRSAALLDVIISVADGKAFNLYFYSMNRIVPIQSLVGFLVMAIALLSLASCDSSYGYYQFYDVPNRGWSWDDSLVFDLKVEPQDENILVSNLNLSVRVNGDYEYQNIILLLSGRGARDTVRMSLQDTKGQWLGNCNAGVCEVTMKLDSLNPKLSEANTLVIQQWSRDPKLKGVVSLGLFMDKQ